MKIGAYDVREPLPSLKDPHALAIIRPWVDVGSSGSLTLSQLEAHCASEELASLQQPGHFFDFTRYRPVIYFKEGQRQLQIPDTTINYGRSEQRQDFLFLHLLEPHMSAQGYIDSLIELFETLGVKRYCLLGAMYDMVPHTKPLLVSGLSTNALLQKEIEAAGVISSEYEGPTTILYALSQQAAEMEIETCSLIVHLPQYLPMEEDFRGVTRLMEILSSLYQLPLSQEDIQKAQEQQQQVSHIAEQMMQMQPQYREILSQLEASYDARVSQAGEDIQLSPEVEKFLHDLGKRFSQN